MISANSAASPSFLKIRKMGTDTTLQRRPQRKLHRLAAGLIILLTADIATMLVTHAASAGPLNIGS
jgi:hypothetical protein